MKEKIGIWIYTLSTWYLMVEAIHQWEIHHLQHSRVYRIQLSYDVGVVSQSIFGFKN